MVSFKNDQLFLVTGASSGIGRACALLLNELGASVLCVGRDEARLKETQSACQNPQNAHIVCKDLAQNIDELGAFVANLREKHGKFAGLAHCAGVSALCPLRATTYDYARRIFDINYFAPLMLVRAVADKRNNTGAGTAMVLISSADARFGTKGQNVYAASKAALCASVRAISKEIAPAKMRINCLLPSMISTPMTEDENVKNLTYNQIIHELSYPFGWGEPSDVAGLLCFLLSEKAKFISGQNYVVDSGGGGSRLA